jgi:hypothetical protein
MYSRVPNRGAGMFIDFDEKFLDYPIARLYFTLLSSPDPVTSKKVFCSKILLVISIFFEFWAFSLDFAIIFLDP